jgi:hypothetical protein
VNLDDLIALVRRLRREEPPAPGTPEFETLYARTFIRAVGESHAHDIAGRARRQWRRIPWPVAAAMVAVVVLLAFLVPLPRIHLGGTSRPGATSSTTSPTVTSTSSPVVVHATCTPAPQNPGIAYAVMEPAAQFGTRERLVAVDLSTGTVKWSTPISTSNPETALALTPDGRTLYVVADVGPTGFELVPASAASGRLGHPIAVKGAAPLWSGLSITPDGRTALVANSGSSPLDLPGPESSTVTPVNLVTGKAGKPIQVGGLPGGLAIDPNGRTAYVAVDSRTSGLTPVSLASLRASREADFPAEGSFVVPGVVAISPAGNLALIGNLQGDLEIPVPVLNVVNLRTGAAEAPIHLIPGSEGAGAAASIVFSCDGTSAYAATEGGLERIDVSTRTASRVRGVGGLWGFGSWLATAPGSRQVWLAENYVRCTTAVSANACTWYTHVVPIEDGSGRAGPTVANLPGRVSAMVVGP